jgi:uncharacterized membrane protein YhaH (DUF805 family)
MMGPVQAITTCLAKSFQFSGRASRSEFWWFAPIGLGLPIAAVVLLPPDVNSIEIFFTKVAILGLLLVPFNAAVARRFHDTGAHQVEFWHGICPTLGVVVSGYGLAFGLFAISTIWGVVIGVTFTVPSFLLLLVSLVMAPGMLGLTIGRLLTPSNPGPNTYGPNPLEVTP